MACPHRKFIATAALVAIGLFAAGAGLYWLLRAPAVTESILRQTEGIRVEVAGMQLGTQAATVQCIVSNDTPKAAYSVVMTVSLIDSNARTVATNPLVNVLDIRPGETRRIAAAVPLQGISDPRLRAEVRVNLVRWADADTHVTPR